MSFQELKIVRIVGWLRGNLLTTRIQYEDGRTEMKFYVLKEENGRRMARTA